MTKFSANIDDHLLRMFHIQCVQKGTTMTDVFRSLVAQYLNAETPNKYTYPMNHKEETEQ